MESIKGIVVGLLLFLIAFPVLFWNEGRAIKTAQGLEEGASAVVSLEPDKVQVAMDKKLVHIIGEAKTDEQLNDAAFNVTVNAVALRRSVEMFQWEEQQKSETREKLGGGTETITTYSYNKTWSSQAIDSSRFEKTAGHANPGAMKHESLTRRASLVTLGAYKLSPALINKMDNYEPLPLDQALFEALPDGLRAQSKLDGQFFFIGAAPSSPEIGDTRVSFQIVKPGVVSVIAQQFGNSFEPYTTKTKTKIELLYTGTHSAAAMFESELAANAMLTWILRLVGLVMMFIGLTMVFRPISVVASVVPFIGSVFRMGTSIIAGGISLVLSLVTIAIGWIFYRPLIGILLLVVAAAIIAGVITLVRKKKAIAQTADA